MDTRNSYVLYSGLLFALFCFVSIQAKNGYIYTMPKILRSGSTSEFCLTIYGSESQEITVSLTNGDNGETALKNKDVYIMGQRKCQNFMVPKPGDYELLLHNETDLLHDSVKVKVLGDKLMTFVQTDKPMYKPGQKVNFRVLTLLEDLKPRVGKVKSILVLDPNNIRVKQYLDVETKGIISLVFQLASETKLGRWTIEVMLDEAEEKHRQITVGEFEVKEYVLPRFEVMITPPAYILANQKTVEGKICATYTYGKPVTGYLDLQVCWGSEYRLPSSSCIHEVTEISGCHNFSVNTTELKASHVHYYRYGSELQIMASVTEEGTGATVNKTHSGPSETYEPLRLTMDDYTNGYFKPGLPFYGKVIVTKPNHSPAAGEIIQIKAVDHSNNLKYSGNFTSDSSGVVVYSLCGGFTENSSSISIDAIAVLYKEAGDLQNEGLYAPRSYMQIKQWFSPSLSYIQIPRMDSIFKCGNRLTLSIPFTTRANTAIEFQYQIMARGMVVQTGQIPYDQITSYPNADLFHPPSQLCLQRIVEPTRPPSSTIEPPEPENEGTEGDKKIKDNDDNLERTTVDNMELSDDPFEHHDMPFENLNEPIIRSAQVADTVSNFLLDLTITPVMSPKFTLLVYYVLPDGEVVADSMQYVVSPCFDNEVKMEFNKTIVLPGDKIDIKVAATPGSVCGVGIVDKSVNILGGKHQVTPELVFKKIEEFNSAHFRAMPSLYHDKDDYCKQRIKKMQVGESSEDDAMYWHYSSQYVDALQAFEAAGFMVISNLNLETRPCKRNFPMYYDYLLTPMNGASGLNDRRDLTGLPGPIPQTVPLHVATPKPKNTIRSNFPETWLWDLQIIGESGENVIVETAPHTITNWVGNAMCLNQNKGFGISELTSLTTFQPFFLALHLPYAAVRGERLPILFTVYNYLEKCLHIQLALHLDQNFKVHNAKAHHEPICLCGGKSYTAKYYVTPTEIGNLPIIAKAEIVPGLCGNTVDIDLQYVGLSDAVKRQMLVKAEGVEQEYSHAVYTCTTAGQSNEETVILPLPEEGHMVKNSARGEIKVIGDIMGQALTNLDNLVRMPTGCGEQNMVGFVPNIFVLKYLTKVNRLTEEIKTNAVKYMEIGYQRELTYRHIDGSYSAFGTNDPQGSVWLTAFVVKSFAQAQSYIYIDKKDMALSLKFLRRSQLETGCFRETGRVISSYMMGGLGQENSDKNTALTAYVLIALLTAQVNTLESVITGAIACIDRDFQEEGHNMDSYTLALLAYANVLYNPNSQSSASIIQVLDSKAQRDGSLKYWSRGTAKPKAKNTWYYYSAPSAEVEMTSYSLLAYLTFYGKQAIQQTHQIAMWLSQQRNPNGGFASTQDTVVGLNALAEFASLAFTKGDTELKVTVVGKSMDAAISVSEKNKTTLLLQTIPIPVLPNQLVISSEGVGCVLVQTSVHFNKLPKDLQADEKPSFHLKVTPKPYRHDKDKCDRRTISISAGTRGKQQFSNGMILVSMKMVTSWSPIPQSLTKLKSLFPKLGMKRLEHNEEEGILTFYFDELSEKPREFNIDVEQDRDLAVSSPKPAEVKVFQYYETDVSFVQSYALKTICGTKAEIPHKQPEEFDLSRFPTQVRIPVFVPPGQGLSPDEGKDDCPVCVSDKTEPQNFKDIICNSTSIYKAFAGRSGSMPLKIRADLRPTKTQKNLNIFAKHEMAEDCDCDLLVASPKRVLLLVHNQVSGKVLKLDRSSMVILADKKLEKEIRKFRKICPV